MALLYIILFLFHSKKGYDNLSYHYLSMDWIHCLIFHNFELLIWNKCDLNKNIPFYVCTIIY